MSANRLVWVTAIWLAGQTMPLSVWPAEGLKPAATPIQVNRDGSLTGPFLLRFDPSGKTNDSGLARLEFCLPGVPPERQWLEKGGLPICHTHWLSGGIAYSQTLLLSRLHGGEGMPAEKLPEDAVLLIRLSGESKTNEYTGAEAGFTLTINQQARELELQDDLVFLKGMTNGPPLAVVDVPSGAVMVNQGIRLHFQGHMPPATSGAMMFKIPLFRISDESEIRRLRQMDFDPELARVRRQFREWQKADALVRPLILTGSAGVGP